jgi:NAD(P)H dehydrogenase (quinone)
MKKTIYAVMGITGQVGSAVAETLIAQGDQVRAIVRDTGKARAWAAKGVELAEADYDDPTGLGAALESANAVFVMIPPNFAPSPDFREPRKTIESVGAALERAKPEKIVYLSSIGAQQTHRLGLITALHLLEERIDALSIPTAALRAAWFMENTVWDIPAAREKGKFFSYLQPLDADFALVGTKDIGRIAVEVLHEDWSGHRHIEVAGPRRYTPRQIAEALASALETPVEPVAVPRDTWDFNAPRAEMVDAFNSHWIDFGVPGTEHIKGTDELKDVIASVVRTTQYGSRR